MKIFKKCTLCPRKCSADRSKTPGFCGATDKVKLARAALHFWEEPCISGENGSGTVFFSGCNLKCVYCQNHQISSDSFGKEVTVKRLVEIFCELQALGANNINLVSPTPYVPMICEALDFVKNQLTIPVVYNTGGYESIETLKMLEGYIDIYLTDMKYYSTALSAKYSAAEDYFDNAISGLEEMIRQKSTPKFLDNGILKSGVIVRHLVIPGCRKDSESVLKALASRFSPNAFILSLMSQFTPNGKLEKFPELDRKITSFEYNSIVDLALKLGFDNGYMQQRSSAKSEYTPPFDLEGVEQSGFAARRRRRS